MISGYPSEFKVDRYIILTFYKQHMLRRRSEKKNCRVEKRDKIPLAAKFSIEIQRGSTIIRFTKHIKQMKKMIPSRDLMQAASTKTKVIGDKLTNDPAFN